jgi:hypothetical protein
MGWNDDSWKDGYDAWKLRSPYDDEPEEECYHEHYEADINGRATCDRCSHTWWLTDEEIERERELVASYDQMMRREEWRLWRQEFVDRLAFWRRWRKRKHAIIDDDLPF